MFLQSPNSSVGTPQILISCDHQYCNHHSHHFFSAVWLLIAVAEVFHTAPQQENKRDTFSFKCLQQRLWHSPSHFCCITVV